MRACICVCVCVWWGEVRHWLPTTEPHVQSCMISCKICGGWSGNVRDFSLEFLWLTPANDHATTIPQDVR